MYSNVFSYLKKKDLFDLYLISEHQRPKSVNCLHLCIYERLREWTLKSCAILVCEATLDGVKLLSTKKALTLTSSRGENSTHSLADINQNIQNNWEYNSDTDILLIGWKDINCHGQLESGLLIWQNTARDWASAKIQTQKKGSVVLRSICHTQKYRWFITT